MTAICEAAEQVRLANRQLNHNLDPKVGTRSNGNALATAVNLKVYHTVLGNGYAHFLRILSSAMASVINQTVQDMSGRGGEQ